MACGSQLHWFCSVLRNIKKSICCHSEFALLFLASRVTSFFPALLSIKGRPWGMGSESLASGKYELEGCLDVTICGLQCPQHQLLILDPHISELLHLGLPADLAKQKKHTFKV